MYDYLIVTHLPAFYKVNLYNELSKQTKLFVIFISNETNEKRSADFSSLTNAAFEYIVLSTNEFQNRNKFLTIFKLFSLIRNTRYNKLLLGGWDLPEFWVAALLSPNKKNCLALESTVLECNVQGLKGMVKKLFVSMISTVFASGNLHVELLVKLNYKNSVRVTKGVGIINKPIYSMRVKSYNRRFLYVGRLSGVKNLKMLINVFNKLPGHHLSIVGDGEENEYLKAIANDNVEFKASVRNENIQYEYDSCDIFILPSNSETWGLVVEEALYFGMPIIVSQNCGASELVSDNINGFIINPSDDSALLSLIQSIDDDTFQRLVNNITAANSNKKNEIQTDAYLM